jgi:N-carbamoylputrescine amidase
VYFAACNHVGQEGEWRMSGKSMVISPAGKVLIQASGTEEQVISWDIERDEVVRARRNFPLFRDRRPDVYGDIAAPAENLLD